MEIKKLANGSIVIEPKIFEDERGYFFESFNLRQFNDETGENFYPVQDNESKSSFGVIRGLHFQKQPYAQAKLVRVVKGCVYDFAVDIRKNSPTYGKWSGVMLDEDNHKQFYIPEGYAHGFIALDDNTIFQYKCNNFYNKESEGAINIFDDGIVNEDGITLKEFVNALIEEKDRILSEKDKNNKLLEEIDNPFYFNNHFINLKLWSEISYEAADKILFHNTEYNGMNFTRIQTWDDFDKEHYASPLFAFENGDIVVFNKYGKLEKIKYEI